MKTYYQLIAFFILIFFTNACNSNRKNENLTSEKNNESKKKTKSDLVEDSIVRERKFEAEIKKQMNTLKPLNMNKVLVTQTVCAGQLPNGWVKVNDSWNPTTCGNPHTISYNVWEIERYDDKPVGYIMTICNQSIPNGWVKISDSWNPTCCGHPSSISNNVIQIKRLN
jgi:hypothetical protein